MDTGEHRENGQKLGLLINELMNVQTLSGRASITMSRVVLVSRQRATGDQQCSWVSPDAGRPLPE